MANLDSAKIAEELERLRDTGVTDIYGRKVREGHLVRCHLSPAMFRSEDIGKVVFRNGAYGILWNRI